MAAIKIKGDCAHVKMTVNLAYSLSLVCAGALLDNGEEPQLRQLYESIPARDSMAHPSYQGLDYRKSVTLVVPMHLLFVLRKMLTEATRGGWSQIRAFTSRIKEIDAITPLEFLAGVSDK